MTKQVSQNYTVLLALATSVYMTDCKLILDLQAQFMS